MPVIFKKIVELIVKNPQYIVIVYELLKELIESDDEGKKKDTGKAS